MTRHAPAPLLLAALVLQGCVIGDSRYKRPRDLEDQWMVDKLRLLGVRATPAEARPGDTVVLESLLVDPADEVELVVWLACAWDEGAGCAVDLGSVDWEEATPEELAELGLIGVEPFQDPAYPVPEDILEDATDRVRENGTYVTVQVAALPSDALDGGEDLDYNRVEVGTKLLVVSETSTPNHNPEPAGWTVDGWEVPPGAVVEVDPGQAYDLGLPLPDDQVESYVWMESDGTMRESTEEPYTTWFTSAGELPWSWSLYPDIGVPWVAPDQAGTSGTWWAVIRDRRGGMGWSSQDFRVR